jgi:hypothetical protein
MKANLAALAKEGKERFEKLLKNSENYELESKLNDIELQLLARATKGYNSLSFTLPEQITNTRREAFYKSLSEWRVKSFQFPADKVVRVEW